MRLSFHGLIGLCRTLLPQKKVKMYYFFSVLVLMLGMFLHASSAAATFDASAKQTLPLRSNLAVDENMIDKSFWVNRLYAPTQVSKIGDKWFIVDCWHNRVIWSYNLDDPIFRWNVLDNDLAGPHSIAYGNGLFAVEDTNRHAVNFYSFSEETQHFTKVDTLRLGGRPHRIVYDQQKNAFFVISSYTQKIHKIVVENSKPLLQYSKELPFLNSQYTRSFTVFGDYMLFVSGSQKITVAQYSDESFNVVSEITVPVEFTGMNDIYYTGQSFIITATHPNTIAIVRSLQDVPTMQDMSKELGFEGGRPYYVTQIDDNLFIPEIAEFNAIRKFHLDAPTSLRQVGVLHNFGQPTISSETRSQSIPML